MAYVDESEGHDFYFLTALIVNEVSHQNIEKGLRNLVDWIDTNHKTISDDIEFHGNELRGGKKQWAFCRGNVPLAVDIYEKSIEVIATSGAAAYCRGVKLSTFQNLGVDPHEATLNFMFERIQNHANARGEKILVISDDGKDTVKYRAQLDKARKYGTWGYKSISIPDIIDTLYFVPSKNSRLIQATDLISYLNLQRHRSFSDSRATAAVTKQITRLYETGCLKESSYWSP